MSTAEEDVDPGSPRRPLIYLPRLRWEQLLAISILWFALSFHWSALGFIVLPSQVLKLADDANKGGALAFVLIPGAFVALCGNPLFGMISDRTRGRFALWGRRRPYILVGTLINVVGLIWMVTARDLVSMAAAYMLVQFASSAIQAPFHALLPDIVPAEQRGLASGLMGFLQIGGTIGGVLVAGKYVDASQPLTVYQQGLWLTYAIIIAILVAFMLVTVIAVRERTTASSQLIAQEEQGHKERDTPPAEFKSLAQKHPLIPRSTIITIAWTLGIVLILWGGMYLWNSLHLSHIQISNEVQQVVLEVIIALGLLRLFDFNPRRDPDFAWVLLTRMVMMMGIYTIQTFLQYYMKDVIGAPRPEEQTTSFIIIVSLTSIVSALAAGWLSDFFGRKRLVYLSGTLMAVVGLIFIVTQSLPLVLLAGAIFGLGYGAYQSVDWALVADTLPSHQDYARDMGVWSISLAIPQVIAPVLGGPLIDYFTRNGQSVLGFQLLFAMAIIYCLIGTITVRYIRGVKR